MPTVVGHVRMGVIMATKVREKCPLRLGEGIGNGLGKFGKAPGESAYAPVERVGEISRVPLTS